MKVTVLNPSLTQGVMPDMKACVKTMFTHFLRSICCRNVHLCSKNKKW